MHCSMCKPLRVLTVDCGLWTVDVAVAVCTQEHRSSAAVPVKGLTTVR